METTAGKIVYQGITKAVITEHSYNTSDQTEEKILFEGELAGQTFITPKGNSVVNASIVRFDEPCHSVSFTNCQLLNNEVGVNYAVVSASPNAIVKGKPYIHTTNMLYKSLPGTSNLTEKVAKVENATLITLANGETIAERMLAYYGNS